MNVLEALPYLKFHLTPRQRDRFIYRLDGSAQECIRGANVQLCPWAQKLPREDSRRRGRISRFDRLRQAYARGRGRTGRTEQRRIALQFPQQGSSAAGHDPAHDRGSVGGERGASGACARRQKPGSQALHHGAAEDASRQDEGRRQRNAGRLVGKSGTPGAGSPGDSEKPRGHEGDCRRSGRLPDRVARRRGLEQLRDARFQPVLRGRPRTDRILHHAASRKRHRPVGQLSPSRTGSFNISSVCSPSRGDGRSEDIGMPSMTIGERTDGIAPVFAAAAGRSIFMPRAMTCGSANTSATLLIGPAGTPCASKAVSRNSRVTLMVCAVSSGTSSGRWPTRPILRAESLVLRQLGHSQNSREPGELAVIADGDDHVPVGHREDLIGHDVGMRIAHAARRLSRCQISSWPDWRGRWSEHRAAPCRDARPCPSRRVAASAARMPTTE